MNQDVSEQNSYPDCDLSFLIENIPGGVLSCKFDERLTLLQMNEGFLSMLGYTRRDIEERFHNSYWNMIDIRDRVPISQEVKRQLAHGSNKEIEYRMYHKDGRSIWVLDKGHLVQKPDGTGYFCCILVDITRSKELETSLRLSLERHRIIADQTTDILFEWNLAADTFTFSNNWEKSFGYTPLTQNVSLYLEHAPHILPEDQPVFAQMLRSIQNGKRYAEAELRFVHPQRRFTWCRIRITGLLDDSGHVVRAVGVIVNIDPEKRKAEKLVEQAQKDSLTKLYNKGTCQEFIEKALAQGSPDAVSALLIIDLDNFKHINDTMGHLFGDALLAEVAHTLQKQFSPDSIAGRVGGDEFLVFLPEIPDADAAKEKAAGAIRAIKEMAVRELANVEITCTIGLAVSPECGRTYNELFQKADQALYHAKSMGKDRYCLYHPEDLPKQFPMPDCSAVGAPIDSDLSFETMSSRLAEYAFRILYKSVDLDAAVNAILEVIGRQFDVSRVYIFENDEDEEYCSNTYEWCNDGVQPQISNLQHITCERDLPGSYQSYFNENGIFYCRDISDLDPKQYEILYPQGIKSLLQCAIYDNGKYRGFVGFDECRVTRFWTQEQVNALNFISEILSIFLLKLRAQDQAIQNMSAMESILDNQSSWIYLIRPETFQMLYINRRTLELVPDVKPGTTCYRSFFHRDSPCEFCPAKDLSSIHTRSVRQVYNPVLKVWTSADACRIQWKGRDALLLTCHDITALKKEIKRLKNLLPPGR